MIRSVLPALALALAGILPAACSEAEQAAPEAPEGPEGIAVTNARIMLPAVSGNPAAVYFDIANSSERNAMVRAVNVQGAESAAIHQIAMTSGQQTMNEVFQTGVNAGQTVSFAPGGLHVMASDLADTVKAGGETEVTLSFVNGDKLSFPAEVRTAGDER